MSHAVELHPPTLSPPPPLEGPCPVPYLPTQQGEGNGQTTSTLEPSSRTEGPSTSIPVLDRPLPMCTVAEKMQKLEAAVDVYSMLREGQIEKFLHELSHLHGEESIMMDKSLAAQKDVTFWTTLEDLANVMTGAISIVLGGYTLGVGHAVVGGALIASGVASIANIAFKYGNVWDYLSTQIAGENKELQTTLRTYMPAALGLTAATLSLYCSYQIWNLPGLTSSAHLMSILQTGSSILMGSVTLGKGFADFHLKISTSAFSALQTISELLRLDLEDATEGLQEFHQRQLDIKKIAAERIQAAHEAVQMIHQPV